jgi:PKD repeat protein
LRQEAASAYGFFGPLGGEGYYPALPVDPTKDYHAILWSEASNELVEAIGYSGTSANAEDIVTWDLSSYTLPRNGATAVGVVAAKIPFSPLLFTYADVVAATGSGNGDLGHMLGWIATNYKNASQWPARGGDGEMATGLPAGSIIRLAASFPVSGLPNESLRVIARTLQRYGALLYDKNYTAATLVTANDPSWPQGGSDLGAVLGSSIPLSAFEWVDVSGIQVSADSLEVSAGGGVANVAPTAAMSATPSTVTPLQVAFSGASSTDSDGSIVSYAWNFGDGTTGSGVTTSRTYAASGTYTVTLTVTDDDGATGTTTQSVTTWPQSVAAFTTSATGLSVRFNASASTAPGGVGAMVWDFGDGTTGAITSPASGSAYSITHTYANPGTYAVDLDVKPYPASISAVEAFWGTTSRSVSVSGLPCSAEWNAPPGYNGAYSALTTGSSASFSTISGMVSGDVMLMTVRSAHTAAITITPPAGWQEIGTQQTGTAVGGAIHTYSVFWKAWNGSETFGAWTRSTSIGYTGFERAFVKKTGVGTPVVSNVRQGSNSAARQSQFDFWPDSTDLNNGYTVTGPTSVWYTGGGLFSTTPATGGGVGYQLTIDPDIGSRGFNQITPWNSAFGGFTQERKVTYNGQTEVYMPSLRTGGESVPWLYKLFSLTYCPTGVFPIAAIDGLQAGSVPTTASNLRSTSTAVSGSITSYLWDFGNGTTSTVGPVPPSPVYTIAGDYVITLTVTNSLGYSSSVQGVITAYPLYDITSTGGFTLPTSGTSISPVTEIAVGDAWYVQHTSTVTPPVSGASSFGQDLPLQEVLVGGQGLEFSGNLLVWNVQTSNWDDITALALTSTVSGFESQPWPGSPPGSPPVGTYITRSWLMPPSAYLRALGTPPTWSTVHFRTSGIAVSAQAPIASGYVSVVAFDGSFLTTNTPRVVPAQNERCADNGQRPVPLSMPMGEMPSIEYEPLNTLGNGQYEVWLLERGGGQIAQLTDVTDLSWGRTLDDTSSASVTCINEEWADLIHPWMHEISILRNGKQVWVGPVRDKEVNITTGEVLLSCRDLSAWFDKRLVHDEVDVTEVDMCDYLEVVLRSALRPDPSPNIAINKTKCGLPIDRYLDIEIPRIAGEELRDIAGAGVDFTVVNRTMYLRGEQFDATPVRTLLADHFVELPIVKESGNMATQLVAVGEGGDRLDFPQTLRSPSQWDLHPYGLLEDVFDATSAFDSDDARSVPTVARNRLNLLSRPPLYITDGKLDKSAPVAIANLIPGKRVDVRMEVSGVEIIEQYRLQAVSVSASDTGEEVSITLTALGSEEIGI